MEERNVEKFIYTSPLLSDGGLRKIELAARQILIAATREEGYHGHGNDRQLLVYDALPESIEIEYRRTFHETARARSLGVPQLIGFRALGVGLTQEQLTIKLTDAINVVGQPFYSPGIVRRQLTRKPAPDEIVYTENTVLTHDEENSLYDKLLNFVDDFEIILPALPGHEQHYERL